MRKVLLLQHQPRLLAGSKTASHLVAGGNPGGFVVSLPETLSAINKAGLLDEYLEMYKIYEHTGIFNRSSLKKISDVTNARYVAQLNLSGFDQGEKGRFGMLGIRVLETKQANLRVFLQIWDAQEGVIAWEGYEEMNLANETYKEKSISFYDISRQIAENMVGRMPERVEADQSESTPATKKLDDNAENWLSF